MVEVENSGGSMRTYGGRVRVGDGVAVQHQVERTWIMKWKLGENRFLGIKECRGLNMYQHYLRTDLRYRGPISQYYITSRAKTCISMWPRHCTTSSLWQSRGVIYPWAKSLQQAKCGSSQILGFRKRLVRFLQLGSLTVTLYRTVIPRP